MSALAVNDIWTSRRCSSWLQRAAERPSPSASLRLRPPRTAYPELAAYRSGTVPYCILRGGAPSKDYVLLCFRSTYMPERPQQQPPATTPADEDFREFLKTEYTNIASVMRHK